MIAPIPLAWGSVENDDGTSHAWFQLPENERWVPICGYVRRWRPHRNSQESEERWTPPYASAGDQCQACIGRVGHGQSFDPTNVIQIVALSYPYGITKAGIFRAVNNHRLATHIIEAMLEERLAAEVRHRNRVKYLALRKLREEFGVQTVSM